MWRHLKRYLASITFVQEITKHLLLLKDEIKHYFFNDGDAQACTYTRNPFIARPDYLPVGTGKQEELNDLQCGKDIQEKFKILHWPTSG